MKGNQLYKKFKELCASIKSEDGYDVTSIDGTCHKLGVSKENYPVFFIDTGDSNSPIRDLFLENLNVKYSMPCTLINDSGEKESNKYTVITLTSANVSLQMQFIDIVLIILDKLGNKPSKHDIAREVEGLVSIFEAFKQVPRKKVQGLWAELLIIETSSNPALLINAWHAETSSKYDFTMGRDKLEVKSTSSEQRVHEIVLDQLNPTGNSRLLIASVIVRESGHGEGGLTVDELRDKILGRTMSTDLSIHLCKVIAETIGNDFSKIKELCFDYVGASDSLRFYDYNNVPKIDSEDVGKGVTRVHFCSDFTGVPDVQNGGASFSLDDSPLFKSLIRK